MLEFCTCGAQLPPDALFCHKCGKPQREIVGQEPSEPEEIIAVEPIPAAVIPPAALPVDFHNPIAVRIALMVAAVSSVLVFIPLVNYAVAGFGTTYFYRRRTGLDLNVASGVRLGWITGVLMSVISTIVFAVKTVTEGGIGQQIQAQARALPSADDPGVKQVLEFLQTPGGLAMTLLFVLVFMFVCITGLSMAGGALGARLVGRSGNSRV
jgi:hypothetical protein